MNTKETLFSKKKSSYLLQREREQRERQGLTDSRMRKEKLRERLQSQIAESISVVEEGTPHTDLTERIDEASRREILRAKREAELALQRRGRKRHEEPGKTADGKKTAENRVPDSGNSPASVDQADQQEHPDSVTSYGPDPLPINFRVSFDGGEEKRDG